MNQNGHSTNGQSQNGHNSNGQNVAPSPFTPTSIGVPPLGGLCSYDEAARRGYGVEENVALLKRFNWVEQCLTDIAITQLNAVPEWEVKGGLALHLHLDAQHAQWLQARVAELRYPPHKFHVAPDVALGAFCQEALRAQNTIEVLIGVYRVLRPALLAAYRHHYETTNPLVDQPTRRFLRFIMLEEEEQIAWGEAALSALLQNEAQQTEAREWEAHLRAYLDAAGGIAGGIAGDREKKATALPAARSSAPLEPDFTPRRDARVQTDIYDFPPHWVYAQRERPVDERTLALVCKRLLEMDVPEMMASIIWRAKSEAAQGGKQKNWDYTADMARQMWDEARHSMLGESWLVNHQIDWTQVPLNAGFSEVLNSLATARESHAALYAIEQGLMPQNSGKAYEWRVARDSGDPLAMLFMDYDWADEVLHVHIGRHLTEQFPSRKEAETVGNEAFARVMAIRAQHDAARSAPTNGETNWWYPFVQRVLGYEPAPIEDATKADATPWKNG